MAIYSKDSPADTLAQRDSPRAFGRSRASSRSWRREAWTERDPAQRPRATRAATAPREGKTGAEIGAALNLTEGTVRNYLSEAISKVGAKNRIDAARIARDKGWL